MSLKRIDLEELEELKVCPVCGYTDGFHLMFQRIGRGVFKVGLICPNCHQAFQLDWQVEIQRTG